jgi:hypothetical protein
MGALAYREEVVLRPNFRILATMANDRVVCQP